MEAGLRFFLLIPRRWLVPTALEIPALPALAVFLLLWSLGCGSPVFAQTSDPAPSVLIQPEIERTEVDLAAIDTEDFEIGFQFGLLSIEDFGVQSLQGLNLSYHITPQFFADLSYGRADAGLTSFERLNGAVRLLGEADRRFEYYVVSLGYSLFPGEAFFGPKRAFNSAFYVLAGMGSTTFAGSDHFTFSYGFGYRVLMNDWLAVHLGARDHMLDVDVFGESRTTHNLQFNGTLSVFF